MSFEKLNATEKAGDRLELARLLLDCLFSKAEQGSISFASLDPMKLNALRNQCVSEVYSEIYVFLHKLCSTYH